MVTRLCAATERRHWNRETHSKQKLLFNIIKGKADPAFRVHVTVSWADFSSLLLPTYGNATVVSLLCTCHSCELIYQKSLHIQDEGTTVRDATRFKGNTAGWGLA